jgi:hypothetical protein
MSIPVIHQTDLFHQHGDPDDHWDLACQFALAYMDEIDLKGVLIDYPLDFGHGDPSIQSVSQMNYITGLSVPVGVGMPKHMLKDEPKDADMTQPGYGGVKMVLRILEEAAEPAVIHIVGSCRDIAAAGRLRPELFRKKCRAVYLNAGSAIDNGSLEYNVNLDPISYSYIFSLPCPVFWMPCFEKAPAPPYSATFEMGTYSTYYNFDQKEILPYLSESVQKYFCYALGRVMDTKWLSYISYTKNQSLFDFCTRQIRNMWSTCGFLHAAGMAVSMDGKLIRESEAGTDGLFTFKSIRMECSKTGRTEWNFTSDPSNRYIFKIQNLQAYKSAMTNALRVLLQRL